MGEAAACRGLNTPSQEFLVIAIQLAEIANLVQVVLIYARYQQPMDVIKWLV